jgi:hypothetical protein
MHHLMMLSSPVESVEMLANALGGVAGITIGRPSPVG